MRAHALGLLLLAAVACSPPPAPPATPAVPELPVAPAPPPRALAALGGACHAGQTACTDARSGLYCSADGTYKAMTCGGVGGCKLEGAKGVCDNDVAAAGDGCDTPNDGACTADGKALVQCKNESFVLIDSCKGPGACKIAGDVLKCDNDIADLGDPCSNDGNFACTSDKGMALRCVASVYKLVQSCRGPKACSILHRKPKVTDIDCDFSVAAAGDPCAFPGSQSCSADGKGRLTCVDGSYGAPIACPGPTRCRYIGSGPRAEKADCTGAPAGAPAGKK